MSRTKSWNVNTRAKSWIVNTCADAALLCVVFIVVIIDGGIGIIRSDEVFLNNLTLSTFHVKAALDIFEIPVIKKYRKNLAASVLKRQHISL